MGDLAWGSLLWKAQWLLWWRAMSFWSWVPSREEGWPHGKWWWQSGGRHRWNRLFRVHRLKASWWCDNYENIEGENNQEAAHLIESRNDKTCHLTEVRVRARGRDDCRMLTAKVMYDVRTIEGQLQKRTCDCQGPRSTLCVGSSDQQAAELRRHSNCVEQGVTNSHKLVIGHHC